MKKLKGFTLVEMAVTLVTVIVLMSISVPIYKSNTNSFKEAEGYALLATIRSAQERYYAEYGNFLPSCCGSGGDPVKLSNLYETSNEEVLRINAKTNKYFTKFCVRTNSSMDPRELTYFFNAVAYSRDCNLSMFYNLTAGVRFELRKFY